MIKKGDILQFKHSIETRKVIEIKGELYAMSYSTKLESYCNWYTEQELKNRFIIPEEKWTPAGGDVYYTPVEHTIE